MADKEWDYFGRKGPDGVYELYRSPCGIADPAERFPAMQRLRQTLEWLPTHDDVGLRNDWLSGWFDFEDSVLSADEVADIMAAWAKGVWPGRP